MMGLKTLTCTAQVPIGSFSSPPISSSALVRAKCLLDIPSLFAILFPLNFMQQFAQPLSSLAQLRLGGAFRTSQHLRDLAMLVPLDITFREKSLSRWKPPLNQKRGELDDPAY